MPSSPDARSDVQVSRFFLRALLESGAGEPRWPRSREPPALPFSNDGWEGGRPYPGADPLELPLKGQILRAYPLGR